jgi:hypothetical protein
MTDREERAGGRARAGFMQDARGRLATDSNTFAPPSKGKLTVERRSDFPVERDGVLLHAQEAAIVRR